MDHYYTNKPLSMSNEFVFDCTIGDKKYSFYSDNGVFSKNGLDYGTKLLLESLPIDKIRGKVLDLGCGYGPIGIFLSKNTKALVHMVDVNDRALELVRKNLALNKVEANAYKSDIYNNIHEKFNYIFTNPPIRAGKKVVYDMLFSAKDYLEKSGEIWLVVRKKQGAKSLFADLSKHYKAEIIKKDKGYYIIKANLID